MGFARLVCLFPWSLIALCAAQQVPSKLNIVIVEGDGAINNIRQRVAREPIVQVEDENRRPVGGAIVTFTLPKMGPGATFPDGSTIAQFTTDQNGRVVARGLRPNGLDGQYQIRVSVSYQGLTASATITQTNAIGAAAAAGAGAAAGGISGKMLAIIAVIGAAAAGGIAAATLGGGGNGGGAPPNVTPAPPPGPAATTITAGPPRVGAP